MKRAVFMIVMGLLLLSVTVNPAYAKWWIFGRAEAIPEITDFFIGSIDISSLSGKELMLDDSNLEGGKILIKGFITKGEAPLAVAKISLDNGLTWQDASLQKDSFIFDFSPAENQEYKIRCKVIDTLGKENDSRDIPEFVMVYRAMDLNQVIKTTLGELIDKYTSKNLNGFMQLVSYSFIGDLFALEQALQSDFRLYDNIHVSVTPQQVNKSGNQAIAAFDFDWHAIKKTDGSIINPARGTTTYTFIQEGGIYKLLKMETPIIFGISEASEITAASTSSIVNDTASILGSQDTFANLSVYTATVNCGYGIDFSNGTVAYGSGDVIYYSQGYEVDGAALYVSGTAGINVYDAAGGALSSVTTAPSATAQWFDSPGYSWAGNGYVYVLRERSSGPYAAFKITSGGSGVATHITIQYKYQSDGSTNLR